LKFQWAFLVTDLSAAVRALESGRPIVMPTDTVYGLAVMPGIPAAVEEVFRIKGRAKEKPVAVLATGVRAFTWIAAFDDRARRLADRFWPGPLTIVLPRAPAFALDLGAGRGVGVRVPDHELALELLGLAGPLAVTSANRSDEPPATTVDEAREALGNEVEVFVDGGRCSGDPSTVVSLLEDEPVILRDGPLTGDHIKAALSG
jgi:L-threonylcarbamoyladenylate synthase